MNLLLGIRKNFHDLLERKGKRAAFQGDDSEMDLLLVERMIKHCSFFILRRDHKLAVWEAVK